MAVSNVLFLQQDTNVINGQDIELRLKLSSKDHTHKEMSIRINAQAMRYYGKMAGNILSKVQLVTLLSGQGLQLLFYNFVLHWNCI